MAILRSRLLGEAGLVHAFPERDVGDAELLAALGVRAIALVKQVHGARVVEASGGGARDWPEGDALVARRGHGAIGVRVADCVPVLVADEEGGGVAAIHAGWRGVVAGVVGAGVRALGGARLVAAIGPCIGACCFEVGRDVASEIAGASEGARVIVRESAEKVWVDLRAAVRAQLVASGVRDGRIEDVAGCTKHESARLHSYRRDGSGSGRMLAAIVARE